MADILQNVKPTRMELLKLRRRVKLADKGHRLLKEKRDALISEFMIVIKEYKDARKRVEENLKVAFYNLLMAEVLLGSRDLEQISGITLRDINLDFMTKNIMGVSVPVMKVDNLIRRVHERGYGFLSTNAKLDDAARNFEESIGSIVKLAEVEESVRRIAEEVEKTKRRVNALEYIVIPRLKATIKHIEMRMEEIERESFLRLKKIKASLEARKK
ncbi:MAG: V-type ATP synthase subunit D [Deltaproteobacteria bacterium]|nr:V-type ATP synthase subunit D [Deltaproteobacteria bacterium]OQY17522.1 MAG: V-type ATP synthase subunit D [Desulfobacterium sp. 4572_20]MBW2104446.1 V-type ATP synthase subunit D [Deltaproteobacteria bacterium]MBW2332016.1 V-type ATP synthase subunit D [Deltaproteobacteria bacterium]MCD6264692.1 V-type ATP synthase subunit D [Deltaproteobacteria bacterium]